MYNKLYENNNNKFNIHLNRYNIKIFCICSLYCFLQYVRVNLSYNIIINNIHFILFIISVASINMLQPRYQNVVDVRKLFWINTF